MDSMEASDWITAGLALAALIVAAMSWWASRTSAKASLTSAEAAVRSAGSSETSAEAAVRSAVATEKSAEADHALLELERQDRAAADLERRTSVWRHGGVNSREFTFQFRGAEAHNVFFEANVSLEVQRRSGHDALSPMYKGDSAVVVVQDPERWDRRITVSWAESDGPGTERLSKLIVV